MKPLIAVFLIILMGSSAAHASAASCSHAFMTSAELSTELEKDALIKNYLGLNLAFPQNSEFIQIGLTAYYFSRLQNPLTVTKLEDKDVERVWTAMKRAHAAHGVNVDVSFNHAGNTMAGFLSGMFWRGSVATAHFAVLPNNLPSLGNETEQERVIKTLKLFLEDPAYLDSRLRLEHYSVSILEILKSPELRQFSAELRKAAVSAPYDEMRKLVSRGLSLVARKLEEAHPELRASVGAIHENYAGAKTYTQAEALLLAMRGARF